VDMNKHLVEKGASELGALNAGRGTESGVN
jgi:hypothetical protein